MMDPQQIFMMLAVLSSIEWFIRRKNEKRGGKKKQLPRNEAKPQSSNSQKYERHVTLSTNKRVFTIGDVHGCFDEMAELVAKAKAIDPEAVIIFAGDVVNKGPKSIQCLKYARQIGAYAIRGNHEQSVLRRYADYKEKEIEPPETYQWIKDLKEEDVEWLTNLPFTITVEKMKTIIVHAGLVPSKPLEEQEDKVMVSARNVYRSESGALVAGDKEPKDKPFLAIGATWTGPFFVVFGHDAKRSLQRYPFSIGLDTGCVYGRELSGIFLDDPDTVLQVPAKEVYCQPNIK